MLIASHLSSLHKVLRILTSTKFISDNTFSVFVQNNVTGVWDEYTETASLFLEEADAKKFEKRLNASGNYEFKFGNNLNGKQLEW